eukprot:TRINITY_DN2051_c0_g1_i1.p1 TRINITY_DN2051_c0_g1~~TRINITY_DN2051_c0_g1_i1.p1  ORF type:complete len:199 (-),score=38.13 TRINITY_DN2051_c0_g1_i1:93-689(-)
MIPTFFIQSREMEWNGSPRVEIVDSNGTTTMPSSVLSVFHNENVPPRSDNEVSIFVHLDSEFGVWPPKVVEVGTDRGHKIFVKDIQISEGGIISVVLEPFRSSQALEEQEDFSKFLRTSKELQEALAQLHSLYPTLEENITLPGCWPSEIEELDGYQAKTAPEIEDEVFLSVMKLVPPKDHEEIQTSRLYEIVEMDMW